MSKPKVGLLTFHFSNNYGALLQAYGLRQWFLAQGIQAEFVNYHPSHVEAGGKLQLPVSALAIKADLKVAYLYISQIRRKIFHNTMNEKKFDEFRTDALGVSGPVLRNLADVESYLSGPEGRFDILLCGSDQIWSPSAQFGFDPVYFLHFSSLVRVARRCSYAPSFGLAKLEQNQEAALDMYLGGLDAISVREKSGVEIASRLTGKPVAWAPDPTILLGDFSDLARRGEGEFGEDHIFCYALRSGSGIREVAEYVSKKMQAQVLSPSNPHRRWREIGRTVNPSPAGWVSGLARARYVVTNSFHGTVFAILFRKPFLTVALPGTRSVMNERSKNLLENLGLLDRLVDGHDIPTVAQRFVEPVDWDAVEQRLLQMQGAGREYLMKQIEAIE